jgi:hypothetical protein
MKKKSSVGFTFFGAFPSDRISKATKDVNEHLFIHSSNYCTPYQPIPVNCTSELRELSGPTT